MVAAVASGITNVYIRNISSMDSFTNRKSSKNKSLRGPAGAAEEGAVDTDIGENVYLAVLGSAIPEM